MPAHASRTLAPAPSAPPSRAERRLLAPVRPRHRPASAATPAELSASPAARPVKLRSVDSGLAERVGVLSGVLWPRSHEARRRTLEAPSPYRDRGFTDQALARELVFEDQLSTIEFQSEGWRSELSSRLRDAGTARLRADDPASTALSEELQRLIADPVDVGFLQFFPVH